jgi:hypothetical protein
VRISARYNLCVLHGTSLTAKPRHALSLTGGAVEESAARPAKEAAVTDETNRNPRRPPHRRAARHHSMDSFIGGRAEDGWSRGRRLAGRWVGRRRDPSVAPFHASLFVSSERRTGTVPATYCTGIGTVVRNFSASPTVCPVQRTKPTTEEPSLGKQADNGISSLSLPAAAAGRQASSARTRTHPQLSVPASVAVRLRSMHLVRACAWTRGCSATNASPRERNQTNRFFPPPRRRLRLFRLPPNSSVSSAPSHRAHR